jgi:hypothetical protein
MAPAIAARRDPGLLAPDERLAEVAVLLAVGYRRLLQKSGNGLDVRADPEAPCADAALRTTEKTAAGSEA